jgi:hypothetical protein
MSTTTHVLRVAAALSVIGIAIAAAMPAATAANGGPPIRGTVTWTTTVVLNDDKHDDAGFGDLRTGTTTTSTTLKIKLQRDMRYDKTFSIQDVGSSYTGTFTDNHTTLSRDSFGTVDCTLTTAGSGTGGGPFPKRPTSTTAPALFAHVVPGNPPLSARTKVLILTPVIRYKGSETTTYAGSGNSPCEPGTETTSIDGSLSASDSADRICLPAGTAKSVAVDANGVVGRWVPAKKAFIFDCTKTWVADKSTITTTIKGTLKYG